MPSSFLYYLSVGSNINPQVNIPACLALLKRYYQVDKISSVYETKPVGMPGAPKFWNLAVSLRTGQRPAQLRIRLRRIETLLGRKRPVANKFSSRTIDLDLLPQPDYYTHAFVMVPLAEIAPEEMDPVTKQSFRALADQLTAGAGRIRRIRIKEEGFK